MTSMGSDVERMSPRTRKAYFLSRLRLVEVQIQALSDQLGIGWDDEEEKPTRVHGVFDQDSWESWLNLDYLIAARDALITTLEAL